MADERERRERQRRQERREQQEKSADRRPTAFEDAVYGKRGWGLSRGDVLFALLTVVAAVALCAVLWVGYGVQGIPGLPAATNGEPGAGVSIEGPSGEGFSDAAIPDVAWSPDAPDATGTSDAPGTVDVTGTTDAPDAAGASGSLDGLDAMAGTFGTGVSGASNGALDGTPDGAADSAQGGAAAQSLVAVVQNTKGFYQVLPLDTDARVTVESELGANVVEVESGRVRCLESDCANQVCVDTGWVATVGAMIVCLPHELTVQVVADAADAAPLA